jgi:hypothetical protein
MGERITGGALGEQPTIGQTVLEGSRRLVALGEGITRLERSQAALIEVMLLRQDGDSLGPEHAVPVSRTKLLDLLKEEQEYIGAKLARILGTLYGGKS